MSYAQNHLVCSSWKKVSDTDPLIGRIFCGQPAGHFGDHKGTWYETNVGNHLVEWPNKNEGKWPEWMVKSTLHGLRILAVDRRLSDEDRRQVRNVLDMIEEVQT